MQDQVELVELGVATSVITSSSVTYSELEGEVVLDGNSGPAIQPNNPGGLAGGGGARRWKLTNTWYCCNYMEQYNTGGGGGGSGGSAICKSKAGGSGIVIIRYKFQ